MSDLVKIAKTEISNSNKLCVIAGLNVLEDDQLTFDVAERLKKPYIYVRPTPKGHGLKNQIEGSLPVGSNVIVIEDLISTGMSSLNAVNAIKNEGSNIKGMLSIFSYSFDFAIEKFKSEKHKELLFQLKPRLNNSVFYRSV